MKYNTYNNKRQHHAHSCMAIVRVSDRSSSDSTSSSHCTLTCFGAHFRGCLQYKTNVYPILKPAINAINAMMINKTTFQTGICLLSFELEPDCFESVVPTRSTFLFEADCEFTSAAAPNGSHCAGPS